MGSTPPPPVVTLQTSRSTGSTGALSFVFRDAYILDCIQLLFIFSLHTDTECVSVCSGVSTCRWIGQRLRHYQTECSRPTCWPYVMPNLISSSTKRRCYWLLKGHLPNRYHQPDSLTYPDVLRWESRVTMYCNKNTWRILHFRSLTKHSKVQK